MGTFRLRVFLFFFFPVANFSRHTYFCPPTLRWLLSNSWNDLLSVMQNPDPECLYLRVIYWKPFSAFFLGSDKLERNTFWNMKTIWNLIIFSIHNEIPVQSVSVHVLIIFRMHYLSVIHCLAIILLVFFPLAFPLCPWLSNNPFFMDAKNKNDNHTVNAT